MRLVTTVVLALTLSILSGCASMFKPASVRQAGSAVEFLYPDASEAPNLKPTVTRLRLPARVGVAFAPGANGGQLSEAAKLKLLERVKASFSQYDYIGNIEIIPTNYLRPRGGFTNLDQVAQMFNVDVVALISYDQVKFNDTNSFAVLYWTIVGAYVIQGDRYDVQTLVDASVFDVRSRKLLFRAPGTSRIKGSATMAGYNEKSRGAQTQGYDEAIELMIPNLQAELEKFRTAAKSDPGIAIEHRPGYKGGGDLGWLGALGAVLLLAIAKRSRASAA
jgi:rhombotail lipoprotein